MRRLAVFFALILFAFAVAVAYAQNNDSQTAAPAPAAPATQDSTNVQPASRQITLPSGTQVMLQLRSPIDTKSAHPGDGVYCQTSFPVTQDNHIALPAGTYVKGEIMHVTRPGRVKGRAELQVHFTSLIFPNGYTLQLPGTLENTPGSRDHSVADKEGTVKADGQKGKDAVTVATTSGGGAAIGGLATGTLKGAGIGGGIGAGVGLIQVLLTRGQDVRLESGTSLEMVLQRPLDLDLSNVDQNAGFAPRDFSSNRQNRQQRPNLRRRTRIPGLPIP